ncbi:phospholipase D-like domain-containing protein [Xanthomonas sacchari]|uniref:Phospholipase n=1 Tax=Xanthomonas sacchari TaxID=56458 RepID=A0A2P5Z512_9XANT|nr:phospholipase D-like domain-containing protein [Xanthomonas sacchari]MDV0438256.1 phospholipase D-like domain-containing protein [Xanthomonas sacchari]PPU83082.1 phospholipase [Xanthomonas sacchari]
MPLASIASAHPARRFLSVALTCLLLSAATGAEARPQPSQFQIVESVPEASVYGEPGVPRTQQTWLAMINGARRRIDIAAFYISEKPGTGLTPVLDALAARARAGVAVHLLVDHTFLAKNPDSVAWLGKVPGITVRVLPVDTLTAGVLHAKYMIVDDASVFVGSQNWDWRALEQIHEIGARIDDARFAKTFAASFDYSWRLAEEGNLAKAQARGVQPPDFAPVTATDPVLLDAHSDAPLIAFPAFSPPALQPAWVTAEEPALVEMIRASQHALRIQVMTLSAIRSFGPKGWWAPVDGAIRDAAARGVQVHIIVADWALREPMQAYLKSLAALPNITVKFSRLPPAPQGFIPYARVEHAKYAVADDRSSVIGTGNWEWSYFNTAVDASVFVKGKDPAETLTRIFDRDWNGPYVTALQPGQNYEAPRTE